jgi:hypothetical protein
MYAVIFAILTFVQSIVKYGKIITWNALRKTIAKLRRRTRRSRTQQPVDGGRSEEIALRIIPVRL